MIDSILIDALKSGATAFIGAKIIKAIGEQEISEIISGAGWAIMGIDLVIILTPIFKSINDFANKLDSTFQGLSKITENLSKGSEFIKKGYDAVKKFGN